MNRIAPFAPTLVALSLLFAAATTAHAQLLHAYTFDNGVNDSVGTANGTLLDGASVSGGALRLDGVDDQVAFAEKIVPTSGAYSVTLFARQNVSQLGSYIEFLSQGSSGGPGFYIGFSFDGTMRVTDSWQPAVVSPSVGVWHHYALTVGGGSSQFYLDGTLRASLPGQIATTISGDNTRFGKQFSPYAEFFNGALDDVQIYGNALSGDEVARLAAGGPSGAVTVPEAGTFALLLPTLGVLGMTGIRRRK